MEFDLFWQTALGDIELQVSRPNFVTWFKNSKLIDKKEGTALIGLPNNFAKEWVENKYNKVVLGALRNLDETTKKVEFVVFNDRTQKPVLKTFSRNIETRPDDFGQLSFAEFKVDPVTNLNSRYTLSSFIVGKSNEMAHAAALAVIDQVGTKYNPLFIYGGVGLGKTHLMQGAGNEIGSRYGGKIKVKYVSSERFTNDVIWAIRNKRMETVKAKYRLVDVLIIDEIQFIAGKAATEEEFFHTFNALYENNKQIIVSSDRPPKFIPTLEERLRSRFEGGMIVDIGYPDYELRSAIIRTKLQEKKVSLSDEVIDFVANKIQKNFREIEGILNKILFYQSKQNSHITPKTVEEIITESVQEPTKNINPNQIIKIVAEFSEVSPLDLINKSRKKEIAESRQILMYLLRDMLELSYPYIGRKVGKRDHTTAMYAYEKISREINKNPALNQKVLMIRELISKG